MDFSRIKENVEINNRLTKLLNESAFTDDPHKMEKQFLSEMGINTRDLTAQKEKYQQLDNSNEGIQKIITSARDGDPSAICYVLYKMRGLIASLFSTQYVGPNKRYWKSKWDNRGEYLSIAYGEIQGGNNFRNSERFHPKGLLETFDPSRVSPDTDMWSAFAFQLKQRIVNASTDFNTGNAQSGIHMTQGSKHFDSNSLTRSIDNEDFSDKDMMKAATNMTMEDSGFSNFEDRDSAERLLGSWKAAVQDSTMKKLNPNGLSYNKAFYIALGADELGAKEALDQYGNVLRYQLDRAKNYLADEYGIDKEGFMDLYNVYGPEKLASYISDESLSQPIQKRAYKKRQSYGKRGSYKK